MYGVNHNIGTVLFYQTIGTLFKILSIFFSPPVAQITITIRKAYGGSYLGMCSKDLGADTVFCWPTTELAVMGAEGAAEIESLDPGGVDYAIIFRELARDWTREWATKAFARSMKKKYGDGLKKYRKDIDCYYTSAFFQIEKDGKVKTFYLYVPDHRLVPMGYRDVLFREARDMQDYAGYQNNNIHIYNFPMEMYSLIDSSFEEEEE